MRAALFNQALTQIRPVSMLCLRAKTLFTHSSSHTTKSKILMHIVTFKLEKLQRSETKGKKNLKRQECFVV